METNFVHYNGALNELPAIAEKYQAKRILFVTGKSSFTSSDLCMSLMNLMDSFELARHSDFDVNPKIEDIRKGILLAKELNPEIIVGIGGGSVLDTAKLISAFYQTDVDPVDVIIHGTHKPAKTNKLVLIPSTAGSGSEATHFAVIYINGSKYSYATSELLPDCVILDSRLTFSVPKELTAVTAFDALSQAIESYWATESTDESRGYSVRSMTIILAIFEELMSAPTPEIRDKMLLASYYAGKAINITKTTAPHALSYAITTKYGVPHGHAVALTLPVFIRHNANINKLNARINGNEYSKRYSELLTLLKSANPDEAADKITTMMHLAGLESRLSGVGVQERGEIMDIVESVNAERLGNNPILLSKEDLIQLVNSVY